MEARWLCRRWLDEIKKIFSSLSRGMEARWLCRRWLCRNCGRPKTLIIEPNVGAGNPHQRAKRGACRNAEKCG